VNETFRIFVLKFGGLTINPVIGGWFSSGVLIMDKISIVYSYVEKITPKG
jgi:hypothetical protein